MGPLNHLLHWSLDKSVLNKLKGTGFDTLRGFNQHLSLNLPLINALIRRYDADTRSFRLGSAGNPFNIAFGLEDVLYLTGLPIDGKPVTGLDPKDTESICQRYLGKHKGCAYAAGRSYISLNWLKENFMTVNDENLSEMKLAYHVRAYVMYAIGCTFAPSHNLTVSAMFLPLLENVDDIGSYAWGAAFLANFHDSIENPTKCSIGFYFPLMVFAFIRFPGLSFMFEIDRTAIDVFPLLVSWSHALGCVMGQHFKNHDDENLETFFDNLKEEGIGEEEVKWQPYKVLSSKFLPQHLRKQVVLSKSRTILICFERAMYHRPDKCQRQLGLTGHVLERGLIEIKTISRTGSKGKNGKDWSKAGKYSDYISEWDKRFDLLIDRDANATPPDEAKASDYQIDALVEANAAPPDEAKAFEYQIDALVEAPDQAKASDHLMDVLLEENATPDQARASDHLMDVLLEENATPDQARASDHLMDVLLEENATPDQARASDHLMDVLLEENAAPDQARASDHTNWDENATFIVAEANAAPPDHAKASDYQFDALVEAKAFDYQIDALVDAPDQAKASDHLMDVPLEENSTPDQAKALDHTNGDENVAPIVTEAGSVNDDDACSEKTVVLTDNEDPENYRQFEEQALLIAELRKQNEKLKEEARLADALLISELRKEIDKLKEEACRAETSLISELKKENEKLKEEIELSRNNFLGHVNKISRLEELFGHQSPAGDASSSRVRNSSITRSCHTHIEDINVKKQRVSPSTTAGVGIVDRAEPPVIIDIDTDSDSDVSISDSYMDALVGISKKS